MGHLGPIVLPLIIIVYHIGQHFFARGAIAIAPLHEEPVDCRWPDGIGFLLGPVRGTWMDNRAS